MNAHAALARIRADISDVVQSSDMDRLSHPLREALDLLRKDAASAFLSFGGASGPAFAETSGRLHETIGKLDVLLSSATPESGLSPSQSARLRTGLLKLDQMFSYFRALGETVPASPGHVGAARET